MINHPFWGSPIYGNPIRVYEPSETHSLTVTYRPQVSSRRRLRSQVPGGSSRPRGSFRSRAVPTYLAAADGKKNARF